MYRNRIAVGVWAAVAALALACTPEKAETGSVSVKVDAVTSRFVVTRIAIDVQPAGIQQDLVYDPTFGTYTGTLSVPVGLQTFTATAWAGTDQVGVGTATVEIVEGRTALVRIAIYDTTGPLPVPDHGPIITSYVVPSSALPIGEVTTLSATAMDPDGDAVSYEWRFLACAGGTLGTATEATTTFSGSVEETCAIELVVRSNGLEDNDVFTIVVGRAFGEVRLSGRFVEQPVIRKIRATTGDTMCELDRLGPNATCPGTISPGGFSNIEFQWDVQEVPWTVVPALSDSCGGMTMPYEQGPGWARYGWSAPQSATVCLIVPSVTSRTLVDTFPFALGVTGCLDDPYEPNDTFAQATPTSFWSTQVGLYANDDDWFSFQPFTTDLAEVRTIGTPAWIEVWTNGGSTLVISGVGAVTFRPAAGMTYLARVHPETPGCGARYDLWLGPPCTDNDRDGYSTNCGGPWDCDDFDPTVNPGAPEVCGNYRDDNCNGFVDDDPTCGPICYDNDADGWFQNCGAVFDCNDWNWSVNPGMPEVCGNAQDDNCNGAIDDEWICGPPVCIDNDGDGWSQNCGAIDCNDADWTVNPGAVEICFNGQDENCNGIPDEDWLCGPVCIDNDMDGWSQNCGFPLDCNDWDPNVNPGRPEVCWNGLDENCDGNADEPWVCVPPPPPPGP